ncbi:MAG: hypothetical protein BIFFINMI_00546 [Phycisphaerae bacterium]|nr:hypothetical protein [Phycisphaerae bacterium]
MRVRTAWLAGLGVVVLLASVGCESAPRDATPLSQWIRQDPASWQVTEGGATHTSRTLASQPAPASPEAPTAPLDGADDYVREALKYNPGIRAAEHKVSRLLERVPQARSLDDPMLMVAPIGEMAQTAAGQVGTMTSLSQKLVLPGKLDARGQVAYQEAAMAVQELAAMRLAVTADTRRAYWAYYFAVRAIEVTNQSRALLSQFRQIAEAKYKAGTASQQDVLRASVELSNLDNELITLRQRQTTAVAMLNSLLDQPVTASLPEPKAVSLNSISLSLDQLLADAAEANPALQRLREKIEGDRQRLRLARLQRVPDLTLSLNYNFVDDAGLAKMTRNGDDQWWIGFSVNVPIWFEKLAAAEREARQGIFESASDLSNEQNRISFRVQDAWVKMDTQQRLVVLFRNVIIPQARQTVEVSDTGYRAGRIDFLTLVDNWRKLLNFQLLYEQSLSTLEQNFAELQQAVGRDLHRGPGPATPPPATQPDGTAPAPPRGELKPDTTEASTAPATSLTPALDAASDPNHDAPAPDGGPMER